MKELRIFISLGDIDLNADTGGESPLPLINERFENGTITFTNEHSIEDISVGIKDLVEILCDRMARTMEKGE